MPQITKTKTSVYDITQVGIDMFEFNESYRKIRGRFRYNGFECYACNRHFADGEKISLLVTNQGNKTACHECAQEFKRELEE